MAERERPKQPNLTPTQLALGNAMVSKLDETTSSGHRALFVINGLSGVGKTVVLEAISPAVGQRNAQVILDDYPVYAMKKLQEQGFSGSIFAAVKIQQLESLQKTASQNELPLIVFTLPGMDGKEARDYLSTFTSNGERILTPDQIVEYSLGVPLLMQQIATLGITEAMAARIAAKYLQLCLVQAWKPEVLQEAREKYIRIAPNEKIINVLHELAGLGNDQIYNDLYMVMTKREEIARRAGVVEESPIFVAPESEGIYDAMLQKNRDSDIARIEIFIPGLGEADFDRIQQALGHQYGGYYEEGERVKMFLASFRKVNMWFRKGKQGQPTIYKENERSLVAGAEQHERVLKTGKNPFPKLVGDNNFFIHSHDHGGLITNPARIGWLMESLLQQRGIPYVVDNYTLNQQYIYQPDKKRIVLLKKLE